MLSRIHILGTLVVLLVGSGCQNCRELMHHRIVTSASGQELCARHRILLITVSGFIMAGERMPTVDFGRDEELIAECNPNCISPFESLRRNRRYSVPHKVTYCPECEATLQEWRQRHHIPEETEPVASKTSNQLLEPIAGRCGVHI